MKTISFKIILPLAYLAMYFVSKWWLVLPIDAPDSEMYGFPLPFQCEGWHTSMSVQLFLKEFFIDYLFYFIVCFTLLDFVNQFYKIAKFRKSINIASSILYFGALINFIFCYLIFETNFYPNRYFEVNLIETKLLV